MGVQLYVTAVFIGSSYKITLLYYTYGCATLSAAYVGYLYLKSYWITLQDYTNRNYSLCSLALPI